MHMILTFLVLVLVAYHVPEWYYKARYYITHLRFTLKIKDGSLWLYRNEYLSPYLPFTFSTGKRVFTFWKAQGE